MKTVFVDQRGSDTVTVVGAQDHHNSPFSPMEMGFILSAYSSPRPQERFRGSPEALQNTIQRFVELEFITLEDAGDCAAAGKCIVLTSRGCAYIAALLRTPIPTLVHIEGWVV